MAQKLVVVWILVVPVRCGIAELTNPHVADLPLSIPLTGPAGSGAATLLKLPDVQAELGMTTEQLTAVRGALWEIAAKRRTLFRNLMAGKVFAEPIDDAMLRQLLDEYNKEIEARLVAETMTSTQSQRLQQLLLQLQGVASFQRDDVAEALELNATQRKRVASTLRSSTHSSSLRNRATVNTRVLELLTPQQQTQWQELQGAAFEFSGIRQQLERARRPAPTHRQSGPRRSLFASATP